MKKIFITILVLVSANDYMIVPGIYNNLFHYPFQNLFVHTKHLNSLLHFILYKISFLFRGNAIWNAIS